MFKTVRWPSIQIIFIALVLPLLACGTFQVGVEDNVEVTPTRPKEATSTSTVIKATPTAHIQVVTATPAYDAEATITTLSTENAALTKHIESLSGTLTALSSAATSVVQATVTPTPLGSTAVEAGWQVQAVVVAPGTPGRLYVHLKRDQGLAQVRLLLSDDFGETWQPFEGGLPVRATCLRNINLDYATQDALYASTCEGLYRWVAEAWELVTPKETGMVAIVFNQPQTLWATEPFGPIDTPVIRSDNGGDTWSSASRYLSHANGVATVVLDPQNSEMLYAVVWPEYAGSYLRRGTANGQWEKVPSPLKNSPIGMGFTVAGDSSTMYVTTAINSGQLWRAPNPSVFDVNRIQWDLVHDFGRGIQVELLASGWSPQGVALYANLTDVTQHDEPRLHRSLDGGRTWTRLAIRF